MKRTGSWWKGEGRLHSHPKVLAAGNAAVGAWVRMCCWCAEYRTDGVIPGYMVRSFATEAELGKLLTCGGPNRHGLLEPHTPETYQVHDFLDYNPSAAEWAHVSAERARAGAAGAAARWDGKRDGNCHGNRSGKPMADPDPDPDPDSDPEAEEKSTYAQRQSRKKAMPEGWVPDETRAKLARDLGLDVNSEADAFRDWTGAKGYKYINWQLAFASHLRSQVKRENGGGNGTPPKRAFRNRLDRLRHELTEARKTAERTGRGDHWQHVQSLEYACVHERERRAEQDRKTTPTLFEVG